MDFEFSTFTCEIRGVPLSGFGVFDKTRENSLEEAPNRLFRRGIWELSIFEFCPFLGVGILYTES
jgi:hypothetical protein